MAGLDFFSRGTDRGVFTGGGRGQFAPEEPQGALEGVLADGGAITAELAALDAGPGRPGAGQPDQTHGFFRAPAAGAGHAGHRQPVGRAQARADVLGHEPGDLFADGADGRQDILRHAQLRGQFRIMLVPRPGAGSGVSASSRARKAGSRL